MDKRITITGFTDEIDKDLIRQLEGAKALGMEYFDPRNLLDTTVSLLTEAQTEEVAAEMERYGIKAGCIGSRIGKINIDDDFAPHLEELQNTIRIAKRLGTKYIRIFSFFMPKDAEPEKYRDAVMDRMRQMADMAEKEGVMLLHENEKGIYGDVASRCLDILETVQSPALGCIFDPANFVQCGQDCLAAFEMLAPFITYMHIKDATADGKVVPAGEGNGAILEIIKGLLERGFTGFACLEPHLGSFEGLQNLELDDTMLKLEKSDLTKFAAAQRAFVKILEEAENFCGRKGE